MHALCDKITDDMLREIADADYGMDFAKHFAALTKIRDRVPTEGRMAWEPHEVLALFRWSEFGDNRTGQKPRSEHDFHLMRAFCCTALLEAYADPANHEYFAGENQTLAQLLDSVAHIDGDETVFQGQAISFLAWLVPKLPDYEDETAFYLLGLVWLLVRQPDRDANVEKILRLIDRVNAEENRVRQMWGDGVGNDADTWLLGTTHFGLRHKKWRRFGHDLGALDLARADPKLTAAIQEISQKLA